MRIERLYDYLSVHRGQRRATLAGVTIILAVLLSTLHFSEDISDFLPLGTVEREYMDVYQGISGADRLLILFSNDSDTEQCIDAVGCFTDRIQELDVNNWCESLRSSFDMDDITGVSNFVYEHVPYLLTPPDYERMDTLMSRPDYIESRLDADRLALMFPSSSLVSSSIAHDPLGLFTPVLQRLNSSNSQLSFETLDGCIFTPDLRYAIVMMTSPFGSSETDNNSRLLAILNSASESTREIYPEVNISVIGGPAIAVGNSSRIKKDSVLAIALSAILIILLLIYSFKSFRNILLILLSVGWGLLFALGGMAVFNDKVSIIVIGISSVILGIAINYPLHLIAHSYHRRNRRECLKEICSPLVVGNITTVGAFLALLPLKSTALRDLGLFASLLLVGTIVFVLVYLPHYIKGGDVKQTGKLITILSKLSPEKNIWVVTLAAMLTGLLAYFSFSTEFDSDMSHINYMTPSQREDMQYFEDLLTGDTSHSARTLYVYGKGDSYDEAFASLGRHTSTIDSLTRCGKVSGQNEVLSFLVSKKEQRERLDRWKNFVEDHREELCIRFKAEASKKGFSETAFRSFNRLTDEAGTLETLDIEDFSALTQTVFLQNLAHIDESDSDYAVCGLNVLPEDMDEVKTVFSGSCFDIAGINEAMTSNLSDNFNYIGWACSLIVFIFLWFSFGRLELAVISFLPMAISWIWILGLMSILGIKFNIVNIILATFIFGQGDDYTIFVTEGCQHEFSRRTSILSSYKSSILQSAAIMFAGIGTLIVARHPAMKSLAEVTIIGMASVVLMAYMIPPLLFRFITTRNGIARRYPITLKSMLLGAPKSPVAQVESRFIYKGREIESSVRKNLKVFKQNPDIPDSGRYECQDKGYGELAILEALTHPSTRFTVHISDEERRSIAEVAADGFVTNIEFIK